MTKHFHGHHRTLLSQPSPDAPYPDLPDSSAATRLALCLETELRDERSSHVAHRARFLAESSIRTAGLSLELSENEKLHSSLGGEEWQSDPSHGRDGSNNDG